MMKQLKEKNAEELLSKDERIEELTTQVKELEAKQAIEIEEIKAANVMALEALQIKMRERDEQILGLNTQIKE